MNFYLELSFNTNLNIILTITTYNKEVFDVLINKFTLNMKQVQHTDILKLFNENKLVKVAAPMVRYSKLQFRTLLGMYNCDLCYTPMILADSFHKSAKARRNEFTTNSFDTPVVTQFAANNVNDFIEASKIVAPYCDGVDLNCGCPQRWAKQMGIGCVMLENPELIRDLVKQCRNQIPKPFTVSVKMRLLKDIKSTIEICRTLDKCGVSYLSIHGRTASQLTGEVDPTSFKLIVENVNCPVIANGGVKSLKECYRLQETTQCKGVMVANSILTNPTLFSGCEKTGVDCIQNWIDICYNSTLSDYEYSDVIDVQTISEKPAYLTFQCFHHHLVFMLEKVLPRQKRRIFNNLQKFSDVLDFLDVEFNIKPKLFNDKDFNKYRILPLWISELEGDIRVDENYYEANSGKFFSSKVNVTDQDQDESDYDLGNIFIETIE